ncbi:unnamed protein product [Hyaloperonospora brassicae]|uniref:Uncharacterized protein n=1 Tax=Hyaloperonospora brassicae TaxID=162125 RepID=A0AAV0THE2_HYABA|nr:unnamed protein product [Hyaloperonospora brassicae]
MKAFLVLAFATTRLLVLTHAAASCSDCSGEPCILDGTSTSVTGGATSLVVQMCNSDRTTIESGAIAVALRLGLSARASCDTSDATLPTVASLVAADGCTPVNCAVTIHFASALDWATARPKADGQRNTLTAQVLTGRNTDVVTIATLDPLAPAVVNGGATEVSVCARALDVSGSRFSRVGECNVVQMCRGTTTTTTATTGSLGCATEWRHTDARVHDVQCTGEACTGTVKWTRPLPCDGSVGEATSLLLSVTVASPSSESSPLASVGNMIAPTFNISSVSGLDAGSADVVLTTDTFCADTGRSLIASVATASDDDSEDAEIGVRSVNATTNGTVLVQLTAPLSSTFVNDNVELSLSQCGVSTLGSFPVGKSVVNFAAVSTGSMADVSESGAAGTRSTGLVSTQEMNASAGLSNSIIVAAVIGAVAIAGFVFEYIYHKRRQPTALVQESAVATPE